MAEEKFLQDKKYGVLGLGKFGLGTAAFLKSKGAMVKAWDDNPQAREGGANHGINIEDLGHVLPAFEGSLNEGSLDKGSLGKGAFDKDFIVDGIFPSPGIALYGPCQHPWIKWVQQHQIPVLSDIDLLKQWQPEATYIGITGTNGKSTTTVLIAHLLQQAGKTVQVGGNLGTPVLQLAPLKAGQYYIIELSSYNLDLLQSTVFDIGVFLNLTPDHLQRHGTMERYYQAKMRLFHHPKTQAVIGIDSLYTQQTYQQQHFPKVRISGSGKVIESPSVYAAQGSLWCSLKEKSVHKLLNLSDLLHLQGVHNWENATAATAVALLLGIAEDNIVKGLKSFPGIAHRQQKVGKIDKVVCINDSKATSVEAAGKALQCYDDIYWILGGDPKEDDLQDLAPYFDKIKHAFIIGTAMAKFQSILKKYGVAFTLSHRLNMAVPQALQQALKAGTGTVLLSPACTSWDQFKSFEHRGQCFIEAIYHYCKENHYVCQD